VRKRLFKLQPILIVAALVMVAAAIVPAALQAASARAASAATSSGDWPTYLHDNGRSGFNSAETIINQTSAPNLKLKWSYQSTGCPNSPPSSPTHTISTQPVVVNGLGRIFWGSWDGCEHATALNGSQAWATYIGQTTDSSCTPPTVGVASTVTYTTIHGNNTPVDLVGGGDANFYALNANTGAIIWKTSLGSSPSHFIWSSPAVYNGSVYVGVASFGDCPLVQGQLVQMKVSTGVIQNIFNVVPNGCTGGGVWGSPTIDEAAGTIYFATGNAGSCSQAEPAALAVVELSASNLALIGSWQVPTAQQVSDGDFGSTPTLFQATINGSSQQLLGVANKNGIYYALVRGNLGQGPVWQAKIASGGDCPQCGQGSISPSAWDGSTLYAPGGNTTINGTSCQGSLRALNPANGTFIWEHCLNSGPVLGAVTVVPGVVVVGQGTDINVIAAATGQTLFFTSGSSGATFYGGASISNGVLYVGDTNGNLFAFAP
jgi:polyvinyl alcohol dehydrogenase (cytochrome)